MIRSAVLRLSLLYLAIAIIISLSFSWLLYRTASEELDHELRRPPNIKQLGINSVNAFERFRTDRLNESRDRLRTQIIILDVLTLVAAGGVSYYAARRTLLPIAAALATQTRFAGDASHELRTPLAAMQTEIEVSLRDKGLTKAELRELLASNLEEVNKLQHLSENLLLLASQAEARLTMEPLDSQQVIRAAMMRLGKPAAAKNIKFNDQTTPQPVVGNAVGLEELSYILLDNAIKYSPSESVVTVSNLAQGKHVTLAVSDRGIGITPDKLPHIFERFYRADASRNKTGDGGYGLGLAIAADIARLHHTSVRVQTKDQVGTTFSINLNKASL